MVAKVIFWLSVCAIVYTYVGYLAIVNLIAQFLPDSRDDRRTSLPTGNVPVSIIVTAHNEERVIERRIQNLLDLDYPSEALEIIVASDGSTDTTVEIARRYQARGVKVLDFGRMGKGPAQNEAVVRATGEILFFTDADTEFDPGFVRAAVSCFQRDSRVGCVVGKLQWRANASAPSRFRTLYWGYEQVLRETESRLGILACASGAAMAVKKALWVPMASALDDPDNVTPVDVVLKRHRVRLASEAVAYEVPFSSAQSDFRSKVRAVSKWIATVPSRWGIGNLFKHPLFSWNLLSHFVARWVSPYFMMAAFLASLFLLREGAVYQGVFFLAVLGICLVLIGYLGERLQRRIYVAAMMFSFAVVNFGFAIGLLRGAMGAARGPFETE